MTNSDPFDVIADYYDLDLDGFLGDLDLYENFARRADAPVLELGVGTGRLALPLAQAGFQVVGIDSSEAMLAIARRKAEEQRTAGLRLVKADMAGFSLDEKFGLAFCALGGFLHLPGQREQIETLRRVREHLLPDGVAVIDIPVLEAQEWEPGARALVLEWTRRRPDGVLVSKYVSVEADPAKQTQHVTQIYEEWGEAGSLRRRIATFEMRYPQRFEMELILKEAGLEQISLYGSYDLDPFDSRSQRMVFVAMAGQKRRRR
ncbi:MAG: class I SAM-dependent methyltransferase [Dehalococcoidia bacterium]|nr:class I SAM-dependent methyltransferase [Dehalococcoidia bacterium]